MSDENYMQGQNIEGVEKNSLVGASRIDKEAWKKLIPYGLVLPSLVIFGVFMIYPVIYMVYLSFYKWNMLSDKQFIGIQNYLTLFQDPDFYQVLGTTFKFMIGTVVGAILLGLLLALYLSKTTKINKWLQGVVFAPYVVSLVAVAFIFMWMMDSDIGLLNYVLTTLGFPAVRWLEDPKVAIYSLVLVNIWKDAGYYTVIFIAALQSIPPYLYEAAKLDKAGPIKTFFKITLPMLSPTLFFVTLTGIIACMKVFETIKIMTQGANQTDTIVYNIYEYGFSFYKIGYASTIGVVLMVIISVMTLFYFRALSKRVHYQ